MRPAWHSTRSRVAATRRCRPAVIAENVETQRVTDTDGGRTVRVACRHAVGKGSACGLHMHVHGAIRHAWHAVRQCGTGEGQRTWLWKEALGQEDLSIKERLQSAFQREEVLTEEGAAASWSCQVSA